jgi:hypothetical protein
MERYVVLNPIGYGNLPAHTQISNATCFLVWLRVLRAHARSMIQLGRLKEYEPEQLDYHRKIGRPYQTRLPSHCQSPLALREG